MIQYSVLGLCTIIFATLISLQTIPQKIQTIKTSEDIINVACIPAYINILDDASISKYVGPDIAFTIIDYKPDDLVVISGDFLRTSRGNMSIRQEAMDSLRELSKSFYEQFSVKLDVVSGYRSYGRQTTIAAGCSLSVCARPGHSEHQGGLAIDLFDFSNAEKFLADNNRRMYYTRLMEHAYRYGWHNSYQKGIHIDGYHAEPRHWRYLGEELATYLYEKGMTFTECVLFDRGILEE